MEAKSPTASWAFSNSAVGAGGPCGGRRAPVGVGAPLLSALGRWSTRGDSALASVRGRKCLDPDPLRSGCRAGRPGSFRWSPWTSMQFGVSVRANCEWGHGRCRPGKRASPGALTAGRSWAATGLRSGNTHSAHRGTPAQQNEAQVFGSSRPESDLVREASIIGHSQKHGIGLVLTRPFG